MKKFIIILLLLLISSIVNATVIKDIVIEGNERVSSETILMFSNININDNIDEKKINKILIDLYETNFFDNIKIDLNNSELKIIVKELPIIESINFTGLKAKKHKEAVKKNLNLRSRSSYNKFLLSEDKNEISNTLKGLGYYFSNVDVFIEDLSDNKVNINYKIDLGNKAKIKKISFIGNKIFKEGKLKSLIISEEYKFWKFISGKKFLNENLIKIDERLLKNFYLNKGYYNVTINTSFAKIVNDDQFELIYNIDPGRKIYFNDLSILYPSDFRNENFDELSEFLVKLKGEPYSINTINQILDRIDKISINEEFQSVKSEAQENFNLDKIDITFRIEESEKFIVDRINIYGNNITRESVIRNQLRNR
jgi:outer membrane protein insertion porin family